ncbi:MAG: hypothetical protein EP319_14455 [Deltaproteobacteria bacterium]|nr:MAG: hypothetical protein EP319_14455 [Deltaproteobacteria bacterium]
MDLTFTKASKESEYKAIYDHNLDAFTDTPDFKWNLDEIKKEVKDGWELYSVVAGADIISAVFIKKDKDALLSKNTAIKMSYQGSGFSHQIKEFIERKAKELKAKEIYHYCRIDNFRMYSLNESHGYKKTNMKLDNGQIVEWMKKV